jgi:two-component system, OmpR family, sensor histidine kinase MprB
VSFRRRLTLFSAGGIALVLIVGSVATYVVVRDQLRDEIDASLERQSRGVLVVRRTSRVAGLGVTRESKESVMAPAKGLAKFRLQVKVPPAEFGDLPFFFGVIGPTGKSLVPNPPGSKLPVDERTLEVARRERGSYYTDVTVRGAHLRMYVAPAAKAGQAVLVARSLSGVDRALNTLAWSLGITCLIGILLAAVIGAVVARGALRPVRRLMATAERVTHTRDLGERIETDGTDELGRLGATFNEMLDSLEGAIRSQRQLVADASHELRTPLTSLRTNVDLLRQGAKLSPRDRERLLRDVTDEIQELTALVANLVDLARGSQRDLHLQEVDLDEVAEIVVRRANVRFPAIEFTLDGESTTVWGDPEELERALWNLVENAAKWSNGTGRVDVAIADGDVVVRDHGPGVPVADRPFVFDRFYRSEDARGQSGSGLGLAIVRQIAESHGGRVEVDDAPGGGARFRLSLLEAAHV